MKQKTPTPKKDDVNQWERWADDIEVAFLIGADNDIITLDSITIGLHGKATYHFRIGDAPHEVEVTSDEEKDSEGLFGAYEAGRAAHKVAADITATLDSPSGEDRARPGIKFQRRTD